MLEVEIIEFFRQIKIVKVFQAAAGRTAGASGTGRSSISLDLTCPSLSSSCICLVCLDGKKGQKGNQQKQDDGDGADENVL